MAYQAPDHITPKNLKALHKIKAGHVPPTSGFERPEPVTGNDKKKTRTNS